MKNNRAMYRLRFATVAAVAAVAASMAPAAAGAPGTGGREASANFGPWRVSAGGVIGFGLRTKLGFRSPGPAYSGPSSPALGSPADIAARLAAGGRLDFLDGAYIDPSGRMPAPYTQNWRFPAAALDRSTGAVTLHSAQAAEAAAGAGSDADAAFGASIELSRTLYAHKSGFGVDIAAGLSWMRRKNCFKAAASSPYADDSTYVYTPSAGSANKAVLTSPFLEPSGGYYGAGTAGGIAPVFDWSDIGPATLSQMSGPGAGAGWLRATGDYEEWSVSLALKPWWEVTDWWHLTGTLGAGAARSEFDCTVSGAFGGSGAYYSHDTFHEWRCYGIGGIGTAFRIWRIDVSFDVLARFCQDGMDIRTDTLRGKIEKPDVVFAFALGFSF